MPYALLENVDLMLLKLITYEQKAIGAWMGQLEDYFGIVNWIDV